MIKEELEKEAEEYYFDRLDPNAIDSISEIVDADTEDFIVSAYLAGAEPREKQIQIDAEQILALQKQNGELTDKLTLTNNECEKMREELKQRIKENQKLCEQIEKMKSDVLSLIKDRMNDDIDQNIIERLAEKWERKEK